MKKLATSLLIATALVSGCKTDSLLPPQTNTDYRLAEQAVQKWTQSHTDTWNITAVEKNTLEQSLGECREPGVLPLVFDAQGVSTTLYFKCALGENLTLPNLPGRFAYAVIEQLPHGLKTPHWQYKVLTPSSSFTESVYFEQSNTARRVRIKTALYAIYGNSTAKACQVPADAGLPPDCYVQQEIPLQLNLQLNYPLR